MLLETWRPLGPALAGWFVFLVAFSPGCGASGGKGQELDASPPDATTAECSDTDPCAEPLVCVDGECVEPLDECETNGDCDGDRYCCLSDCPPEARGEEGVCLPYGDGETNPECAGDVTIGLFHADIQCEWKGPPAGDAYPDHIQVLPTALVADLPHDSGAASEVVIVTYNFTDGDTRSGYGSDPAYFGVIRILNGQDCTQLETIDDAENRIIAASPPAIADLDGDGDAEIVTHRARSGLVAFTWDEDAGAYERFWVATDSDIADQERYDGPSVHDLNNDTMPEVISRLEVYDGVTGMRLNAEQSLGSTNEGLFPVVGDVDVDGIPEIIATNVFEWSTLDEEWQSDHDGAPTGRHFAYADFGTPGAAPEDFDPTTFDGEAEIVATGNDVAYLATLSGQVLIEIVTGIEGGGPPTIGDFDNDGRPEFASAGGNSYRVFDLDCAGAPPMCADTFIRWEQSSQDLSSRTTGSAIFDFEGDGKAEAVYGDECFTRIYDGGTGEVLYSAFRTSCTWYENPVIADPDQDQNTEILIGSNGNCAVACPTIDPIHRGLTCEDASDCLSGSCDAGYCRCDTGADCDDGYRCRVPPAATPGAGKTCRAHHPEGVGITGLRILRDSLDRWASSRPVWNQHAYSVTNIKDDLSVPSSSTWAPNFTTQDLNNYRQNIQGETDASDQPDVTGKVDADDVCVEGGESTELVATVCNRGLRAAGAALPATFYAGSVAPENVICTSYTAGPVGVGECMTVSCEITSDVTGEIIIVVNDDGMGGQITVECNEDNNTDSTVVDACVIVD